MLYGFLCSDVFFLSFFASIIFLQTLFQLLLLFLFMSIFISWLMKKNLRIVLCYEKDKTATILLDINVLCFFAENNTGATK